MATLPDGEWDGICACGRAEQDGKRCALGATHEPRPVKKQDETPSLEDLLA